MNNLDQFLAAIQYENCFVSECTFHNNLITLGSDAILNSELQVGVSSIYHTDSTLKKFGRVRLILDGDMQIQNAPDAKCTYHLVLEGEFSTDNTVDDQKFIDALWINGSTVLYGIARAKLETISTSLFHEGKISLPMINMLELIRSQSKGNQSDTTQKITQ